MFLTANQAIYKNVIENPDLIAITDENGSFTYRLLADNVLKITQYLKRIGLKESMHVALSCSNRPLYLILILALENLGAIRTKFISKEISDVLISDNRADFNFTQDKTVILIDENFIKVFSSEIIDQKSFKLLGREVDEDTKIFLSSTSGTTGHPKFFYETYKSLKQWGLIFRKEYFKNNCQNNICLYSPELLFAYATSVLSFNLSGQTIYFYRENFGISNQINETSFFNLLENDAHYFYKKKIELKIKIQTIRILGSEVSDVVRNYLKKNLCHRVTNSYSSNEFGQVGSVENDGFCHIFSGVNVKIVDDHFNVLPFHKKGRIAIKSDQVFDGYIDQNLNQSSFKDHWFISNDYGYMIDQSTLKVLGRIDNLLNIGGIKYPSLPLERELEKNAYIEKACLFSDSKLFGVNQLIVCIERHKNSLNSFLDNEIRNQVNRYFSNPDIEIFIYFLEDFPRTQIGKVRLGKLKNLIASQFYINN